MKCLLISVLVLPALLFLTVPAHAQLRFHAENNAHHQANNHALVSAKKRSISENSIPELLDYPIFPGANATFSSASDYRPNEAFLNSVSNALHAPNNCNPAGFDLFDFTGNTQSFVVPDGVTSVTITADGGDGGSWVPEVGISRPGGGGGSVTATFNVTPGDNLLVIVGGRGGGGEGGGGGGGGTAVVNSTTGTLLVVAGGGGGGTFDANGRNASATAGNGNGGSTSASLAGGGGGILGNGANSAGGGFGGGQASTTAISSGGNGVDFGGSGGVGFGGGGGGGGGVGGGGGGYSGGNTGNNGLGGGGGTNFVAPGATNISNNGGSTPFTGASNGQVRIAYVCPGVCVPDPPQDFNYTGGVQNYVVPENTTSVTIRARGGDGGPWTSEAPTIPNIPGGGGGSVTATFNNLMPGDNLLVIVGRAGVGGEDNGGGGGGTAVINCGNPANCATGTILVVAGGGGGSTFDTAGGHASTVAGNGNGGSAVGTSPGSGGGGINGAGQNGSGGSTGGGQASRSSISPGGNAPTNAFSGAGGAGFGGGGGANGTGGGGGGYSGGDAGQGGTNFVASGATNVSNNPGQVDFTTSNGSVTISYTCELPCPDFTTAAPAVNVVNSTCISGCAVGGGSISAPSGSCPAGSTLQYSTNNGASWTTTLPTYNQTSPMTILTRCNCDDDNTFSSIVSSVTTSPGICIPPSITDQPDAVMVCEGSNAVFGATASEGISNPANDLTYQWQVSTNGGGSFSNISGANAATLQLSNVTPALNNNQYRVIVTEGGNCSVTSAAATLRVFTRPNITTAPANANACEGGTATFSVEVNNGVNNPSGWTYQWQESSGGSFVNISDGANYSGTNSPNLNILNTPLGFDNRQYRVVVRENGAGSDCEVTSATATLSVIAATPLTAQTPTVCAENLPFNLTSLESAMTNAAGTFSYRFNGNPVTNPMAFPASNGDVVEASFIDATTNCPSATTITFAINPTPILAAQTPDICISENPFDLTSLEPAITGAAGTFSYTFNGNPVGDPAAFTVADGDVVNVTFTDGTTGCSNTTTITFNVNPLPTLAAPTPEICISDNPFDLTSLETNITNASGTFSYEFMGSNVNNPMQFTANDGDVVHVTFTDGTTGCSNTTTIIFNVNALPMLNAQVANICENTTTFNLPSLETNITNASGTFAYEFMGSAVNDPTQFPANDGDMVNVTFTDGTTGCMNTTTITFVTGETPTAAASDKMICSGNATELTVTNPNNVSGATFNWTAAYNGVTGGAGTANDVAFGANAINETLTNTTGADINVVYTITPVGPFGCTGDPIMAPITVKSEPVGENLQIMTCSKTAFSANLQNRITNGMASDFTWTVSDNPNVTGEADGSGNVINQTLVNVSGSDQIVTYTVTPTAESNDCTGSTFTVAVTVKSEPVGENLQTMTCSNVALDINLQNQINNGMASDFTWTVSDNPNVTGEADGSGDVITQTLVNTSGTDQIVTYTVTPTAESNDCPGSTFTVEVTVDGLTPGVIGNDQTVCITKIPAALTTITPASSSVDITYQWEMSTTSCDEGFVPVSSGVEASDSENLVFTEPLQQTTYFRRRAFSTRDGLTCEAVSNCVEVVVLPIDCGDFPWRGNN